MSAVRLVGLALGAGVVVAILANGRPAIEAPRLGATLTVRAASAGAIEARVPGGGPALAGASFGADAATLKGRLLLVNRSARPIRVSLSAKASGGGPIDPGLAAALFLSAGAGGELASGPLAGLSPNGFGPRRGTVIPGGERRRVPLELRLDSDRLAAGELAGEHLSLTLVPLRQVL